MKKKDPFLKETENLRSLRTLEEIEKNPSISQRDLAESIGVALGIANACIHTLVRKGLIKIRGDNNRKITYHLTKKGILHKSKLAMEWTKNTIDFYRQARWQTSQRMAYLAREGISKIVLYGVNELSEITVIVAPESGIEVMGIIKSRDSLEKDSLVGIPVRNINILNKVRPDAVVFCVELNNDEKERVISEIKKIEPDGIEVYSLTNWDEYLNSSDVKEKDGSKR